MATPASARRRQPRPGDRSLTAALRTDRGAAVTELVIVFPVVLTLVLIVAQLALWAHATHTAQAAASHALSATRVLDGTTNDGRAEAAFVLGQLGDGALKHVTVQVTRDAERATVQVEGTARAVVPFLHLPVRAEAAGPVEEASQTAESAAP
ncbi:TadE/TadG family type IV pilus assembly protein [Streptomyces sp. 4N509B]|uniref:TadE/TadG family type IV pilus assembly protein n=1 Tax=Streptomyces sp. 4N509B TaxID=3457413 RepID=UPI003FD15C58